MKALCLIPALALLAACGSSSQNKLATFTCPNGPSLVVTYSGDTAQITFPDGRKEVLAVTENENIFAKPGTVWQLVAFRTARLTDGQNSYHCDQMAG